MECAIPARYGRRMKLDDVQPGHCHARAQRLFGELRLVREEMGRTEDTRPILEIVGAMPRACYFEAIAAWHKAERLGVETGARTARSAPAVPLLQDLRPGHVLQMIDAVLAQVDEIKKRLGITEHGTDAVIDTSRQPSDVLGVLMRVNRELSCLLEHAFSPRDVYRVVALASAYAARLTSTVVTPQPAVFERRRRPTDCYHQLEVCLAKVGALVVRRGGAALQVHDTPSAITPSDVYDLANLVLCEVAYLHSLHKDAAVLHAFEPGAAGYCLPAHVYQLARTLEGQLS